MQSLSSLTRFQGNSYPGSIVKEDHVLCLFKAWAESPAPKAKQKHSVASEDRNLIWNGVEIGKEWQERTCSGKVSGV